MLHRTQGKRRLAWVSLRTQKTDREDCRAPLAALVACHARVGFHVPATFFSSREVPHNCQALANSELSFNKASFCYKNLVLSNELIKVELPP